MFRVDINVHLYHHREDGDILADLKNSLERFMGELEDEVAKLEILVKDTRAAQDAALARVSEDVADFNTKITTLTQQVADLKQQVAAGNNDPALIQRIKDAEKEITVIKQQADVLDPTKTETIDPDQVPADEFPPA